MASLWDDFVLGAAGVVDLVNFWGDESLAAEVYRRQREAEGRPLTPAQQTAVESSARENVDKAAAKTAAQVKDAATGLFNLAPWLLGAAALLGLGYVLLPALASAKELAA